MQEVPLSFNEDYYNGFIHIQAAWALRLPCQSEGEDKGVLVIAVKHSDFLLMSISNGTSQEAGKNKYYNRRRQRLHFEFVEKSLLQNEILISDLGFRL